MKNTMSASNGMVETELSQRITVRVHVLLVSSLYPGNFTYNKFNVISNPIVSMQLFGFVLQMSKRNVILLIPEFIPDSLRFPCQTRQVNSVTHLAAKKGRRWKTARGFL